MAHVKVRFVAFDSVARGNLYPRAHEHRATISIKENCNCLQNQSLVLQLLIADRELEMLVEERVRIVPMDLRLPLPAVYFRAETQLHVGIVEATLIATGEIVRLDQVHVQVRLVEIVPQPQMKPAHVLSRPAIIARTSRFMRFATTLCR